MSESDLSQTALAYQALDRAIRTGGDVRTAARWAIEKEREEGLDYENVPSIHFFSSPGLDFIGVALLAERGPQIAKSVWRILHSPYKIEGEHPLTASLSEDQYQGSDWINTIWLRVLADDRRPVPVRSITSCDYNITSAFWAAVCAKDQAGIERGIRALEKIERRGNPKALSILGLALRRRFPPPPPAPPKPVPDRPESRTLPEGWFSAEESVLPPQRILPAVTERKVRRLRRADGSQNDFLVESLSCGHHRVEPAARAVPAKRRLCLICSALPPLSG